MELTILTKTENPLLRRTEINARVFFKDVTPSRIAVMDALAAELKAKPETIVVTAIYTNFGDTAAGVHAFVYSDAATMKTIERANLLEKHVRPEPEAPEEPEAAPAEEPVAESTEEESAAEPEATDEEPKEE